MEIFKDCKGYEGLYQVSNTGKVWSIRSQRYMSQHLHHGYARTCLTAKNGKQKKEFVHRLVALAFIDNPDNLPQVNHINEIHNDNRVENLEWVSAKDNINYGTRTERANKAKFKPTLCVETGIIYPSVKEAAIQTGIHQGNIGSVCRGERNTAGGYHWRYAKEVMP